MRKLLSFLASNLMLLTTAAGAADDAVPAKIGRFPQEIASAFTTREGLPSDDVQAMLFAHNGTLYAVTTGGLAVFSGGAWQAAPLPPTYSPVMQRAFVGQLAKMTVPVSPDTVIEAVMLPTPVSGREDCNDLLVRRDGYLVARKDGLFMERPGAEAVSLVEGAVGQLAQGPDGRAAAAGDNGLYFENAEGVFEKSEAEDGQGRRWAVSAVRGVAFDTQGRLWCAMPAGVACRDGGRWRFYTGEEGLPHNDFTCVAAGADGSVWFGTRKGAIRFDGQHWAYRQGRRWLPNDDVRSIAVDGAGNAWFATAAGVGRIERRMMTLAEKAAIYEEEVEKYIKRTPFGYVSEVSLAKPGDKSEIIYTDSDNDGLWTSMYGAGECFAYAATKAPEAKERARKAFEALRFLQKVAQGGEHSPPKGYVARTIRSVEDPDPNIGRIEGDRETKAKNDALWKLYEPRWPKSTDGKWYWKSDTSSDELDGHYFFYPAYYDLVADTEEEKERVREVVRDLTDHLVEHGFSLIDHDGTPTRWGYYGPEALNNDPSWWAERGLKSLSMMSYLAVAEHMTGDPKYGAALEELVEKHGYRANAMIYKLHFGPGSGNQSDDEMAFMSYYNLVKYAKDDLLRKMALTSFYMAWTVEQPEMNPFFNFAYAAFGLGVIGRDQWGEHSLSPWDGWLEDAMATLKGFPLDRMDWGHENSHRLDLVRLPRQQADDPFSDPGRPRGYRKNGKVLPVEERHFGHWNTDPWALDYHGRGHELASGTVFLLPYYLGLYHGFIEETGTTP